MKNAIKKPMAKDKAMMGKTAKPAAKAAAKKPMGKMKKAC